MHRHAISNQDFERIAPLLPGQTGKPGRNAKDNRLFIDAIRWIAQEPRGETFPSILASPMRKGLPLPFTNASPDGENVVYGRKSIMRSKILT